MANTERPATHLDVRNERDRKVNCHATGAVSLAHVAGGTAVAVLRGEVDVEVDEVVGDVLVERVLGLLALVVVLERFEVLDGNAVLLEEVGGSSGREDLVAEPAKGSRHQLASRAVSARKGRTCEASAPKAASRASP